MTTKITTKDLLYDLVFSFGMTIHDWVKDKQILVIKARGWDGLNQDLFAFLVKNEIKFKVISEYIHISLK